MKLPVSILFLIIALASCKAQDLSPETFAGNACDCLQKQTTGDIDTRLDPCFSKPVNDNFAKIHKIYYTDLPSDKAIGKYMMDVTLLMIKNCETFYQEINKMYINTFPEVKTEYIQKDLLGIQDSLKNKLNTDSTNIYLLNRRVRLLTQARKFDTALKDINLLDSRYNQKNETSFVKAYILSSKGEYKNAIIEIDRAINSGGRDDFRFFKAIFERKLTGL